ncbi:MAG: hypothetical protein V3R77_05980 [Candidatus Binatia bacterium]
MNRITAACALSFAMVPCGAIVVDAANGDCGQPVSTGAGPTASDALQILKVAVGAASCDECVCNADGAGIIAATDALLVLRVAVGQALPLSCPPCTATTTTSSTTTTVPQGQPQLVTGDFSNVAPCADRDTLPEDVDFLATIMSAETVNLIVNFTQFTTDGATEICGLGDADNNLAQSNIPWDPSANNVFDVCQTFTGSTTDFFNNVPLGHGPDLCQTGNNTFTLAMPRAGSYRKDACIESGGDAYDVRTRIVVSGPSVDATFASLGVARGDLRVCDGNTEIATEAQAKAFVTASPRSFSFAVKSGSCAGTVHVNVTAEMICVDKRTSACPDGFCF